MKRTFLAILACVFAFGLVACEQRIEEKKPDETTTITPATDTKPAEVIDTKPAETVPAAPSTTEPVKPADETKPAS